ncbi:MAG TPA: ATP-binding protein [Polyangia bacterium]|jgi:PAS domain S-box-containing protein|nr:ATP-binding protein [Polyangia bacterium]
MSRLVLIVDDDDALAENIAEIVQSLDVETMIAPDRRTALALAAEHDFDVALIDVRLPDGDGLSLLAPLRARSPFVQSVMVTGDAAVEGAIAAVRVAAFAYVLKPASPPDLLDTVRRALEQSALLRERERLRVELERSEHRHREVVESIPSFVTALDGEGRILTWNRQLEKTTGYLREEMLGTDGRKLVGDDDRPRSLPVKAGGNRKVRWNRAVIENADGRRIIYAVGVDVTDEQEMLRRLLRSERLAAVGTMAAGLAHEVRNPLNSASLQLTVLERRLARGEGPAEVLPIAGIIKSEIDRLDRLVRDFLAFSQPRPLDVKAVDVATLLSGIAALIAPVAEAAKVTLATDVAPLLPPIAGDGERLRQVLLNLTRNAVEAMQASGGTLTLRARTDADAIELDVEDDGPGFAEDLPVFDAFFTTKEQGTGLGLSLVHRIITDHGGTIRVQSRPGRTCFTLRLPATI